MTRPHNPRSVWYLALLAISAGLLLVGDQFNSRNHQPAHQDSHEHAEGSSNDPEKQRRMAAFHYNKGNQYLKDKQFDRAVHQYEMALAHDSKLQEVYVNLSSALIGAENWEKAKQTLDTLKQLAPELPELHYNLACYLARTGNASQALASLQKAVTLGYPFVQDIKRDPDLEQVRQLPDFKPWWESVQNQKTA